MTATPATIAHSHIERLRYARAIAIVSSTFAYLQNDCRPTLAPTPRYLLLEESSLGGIPAFSQVHSIDEAVQIIERPKNERVKFYLHDLDTEVRYVAERRVVSFQPDSWPSTKQPDRISIMPAKVTLTLSNGRLAFAEVDGAVDVYTIAA